MEKNSIHNDNEYFLADWIEGKISAEEFKKYVSEEDFIAYNKLQKGIALYEQLEAPLDHTFEKIQKKIAAKKETKKPKVRKLNLNWAISIAASIVLFIGIYNMIGTNTVLINTTIGEHKSIALLDKSVVFLNSNSEISYDKKRWNKEREVKLKGEAYFKVQKGSTFTVITDMGSVTVLGTQFNVIAKKDYFDVVCYEGKVKVKNNKNSFILTPGKAVRILNGEIKETDKITQHAPTWILGESSFRSVPLKYVIDALEDQYKINFDRKLIDESIIYTGSFSNKNLDIALASVFKATGIKYKKANNKTIVLSK
ncbi:FecR family protein [Lutibacter sp.]